MKAYIVMDTTGNGPLYRSKEDGVLWACSRRHPVTLFPTQAQASRAVKASLAHAEENGYKWEAGQGAYWWRNEFRRRAGL